MNGHTINRSNSVISFLSLFSVGSFRKGRNFLPLEQFLCVRVDIIWERFHHPEKQVGSPERFSPFKNGRKIVPSF